MLILKFILLIHLVTMRLPIAKAISSNENIQLFNSSTAEEVNIFDKKCTIRTNSSTMARTFGLQFHMPLMDMIIEHKKNLYMAQDVLGNKLFVLHGHELYVMQLSRDQKQISLIGLLSGSVKEKELLGVEVISWHEYSLLAVAMVDELEIYQFEKAFIEKQISAAKETVPVFDPIQQLTLLGKYHKHMLIMNTEEHYMLIVGEHLSKVLDKLSTYSWLGTYFDPIEELTLPPISAFKLIGMQPKYLITGRISKSNQMKSALTMHEIMLPALKLKKKQTLTVMSKKLHAFTYHKKNYLITCGLRRSMCDSFHMVNGQFEAYNKPRSIQEIGFNLIKAASNFLVGAYKNEVRVYRYARLDCYTSFKSNLTDIAVIYAYANKKGEEFIILHYRRVENSLLRFVEVEAEGGMLLGAALPNVTDSSEESNEQQQHEHQFENSIGQLRSLLLQRKTAMDTFRHVVNDMSPKLSTVKLPRPARIRGGNIGIAKLIDKTVYSPLQVIQRAEQLRQMLQLPAHRQRRSLVSNSNITLLKVKHLKLRNLRYENDVLPGFYLDNTTHAEPVLSVRSKISTQLLRTKTLATRLQDVRRQLNKFSKLYVRSLNVEFINGIHWNDLYNKLYLKNRNTKIEGGLLLKAPVKVSHLRTSSLNDVQIDQYFNMKQPQVVQSNIFISGFLANKLHVHRLNDLNFAEDLVLRGQNMLIESPVMLYQARIAGDIYSGDNSTEKNRQSIEDNDVKLQQFYTGKIIINGSLTINKLLQEDEAITTIGGETLSAKTLQNDYILTNTEQFVKERVTFGNAKISAPSLNAQRLNNHPTKDHLLNIPLPQSARLTRSINAPMFVFLEAQVIQGNILSPQRSSKLFEISQQAIRHGETANITSTKRFKAPVRTDKCYTLLLNELDTKDLVFKSKSMEIGEVITFSGNKTFQTISIVDGLTVEEELNAKRLNNLELNTLLNYNFYNDLVRMSFPLHAKNVIFESINGKHFDDIFQHLQMRNGQLTLHKKLYIKGNARFADHLLVDYVNDIAWDAYVRTLIHSNEDNVVVTGQKQFQYELNVTDAMNTHLIKDFNFSAVLDNILYKSRPQKIMGEFVFKSLQLGNLDVSIINDISASAFIDLRVSENLFESDLHIPQLTVLGDVIGNWIHSIDLHSTISSLNALEQRNWLNVNVLGNVSWPNVTESVALPAWQQQFVYLLHNAVQLSSNSNITGDVRLKSPYFNHMRTHPTFTVATALNRLIKDSLRKQGDEQVVEAPKNFLRPLKIRNLLTNGRLELPLLNNIDVKLFNMSLWYLSAASEIVGPLRFHVAPTIRKFNLNGSVNGLMPYDIYNDRKTKLPPVKICQLNVAHDLDINDINGVQFNDFLKNLVHKNSEIPVKPEGVITFENLKLDGDASLQSINGIAIDNLVYRHSQHLQAIVGTKYIDGDLVLVGPAHVLWLNDDHLIDSYRHSVFTANDYNYKFENLTIGTASFENGLQQPGASAVNALNRQANADMVGDIQPQSEQQNLIYFSSRDTKIQWQTPANVTVDRDTTEKLIERLSPCQRRVLQAQWAQGGNQLYLENITTNALTADSKEFNVQVENYCRPRRDKIFSKIKIFNKKFKKILGMRKHTEKIMLLQANHTFMLFHVNDADGVQSEIRILRVNNVGDIDNWQTITCGDVKVVQLLEAAALKSMQYRYSLLAIANESENHPMLKIYTFVLQTQKFKLLQTIDGAFDIMHLLELKDGGQQLILTCRRQCQRITIYQRKSTSQYFGLIQSIEHRAIIDQLLLFTLGDDNWYLLVLSQDERNFYHVYKYNHLDGWLYSGHSYYPKINLAMPLNDGGQWKSLQLLLCDSERNCGLVEAKLR